MSKGKMVRFALELGTGSAGFSRKSWQKEVMILPSILQFHPIYQTRVWGGRTLETRFGRTLPDGMSPFGESWEISARDEADSVVATEGPLAGKTLSQLWNDEGLRSGIFGPSAPKGDRFPLLCKILDAREKLSIQVHPPQEMAEKLGGEAKSEVWYIADAGEGAKLYVGVKKGVTRDSFRKELESGTVEDAVHTLKPEKGDYIFIPSGRMHAIGEGLLIYEIQQNSDTTYRVYDWNRVGLDGKPRPLQIEESMACIDFCDIEPEMDSSDSEVLCECEHFRLEEHRLSKGEPLTKALRGRFGIVTVVDGDISLSKGSPAKEGDFFMVPYAAECDDVFPAIASAKLLITTWPER